MDICVVVVIITLDIIDFSKIVDTSRENTKQFLQGLKDTWNTMSTALDQQKCDQLVKEILMFIDQWNKSKVADVNSEVLHSTAN